MNHRLLASSLLLIQTLSASEALTLHPLFTDHMVVQRKAPVRVSGQAAPGVGIRASLGGSEVRGEADAQGRWSLSLPAMPEGEAIGLAVTDGVTTCRVNDILVGDVWLCAGQSNMQWPVAKSARGEAEQAAANQPMIRLLTMPKTLSSVPRTVPDATPWQVCTPASVAGFSAVGYFFARDLRTFTDVPIGLINASWGGTPIQGWMSRESLRALQLYPEQLDLLDRITGDQQAIERLYAEELAAWWPKVDAGVSDPASPWYAPQVTGTWTPIEAGQAWERQGMPDFDGIVWYRCPFDVPAAMLGSACELDLGRVDDWDTTWINGRQVGAGFAHTIHRRYALPADLLKATGNVIAVRVLDYGLGGGLLDLPMVRGKQAEFPLRSAWTRRISAAKDQVGDHPLRLDRNIRHPTQLFNGLIAPLGSLPLKGVLWYQGESNAGEPEVYRRLLPAMIADWRARFASPTLPFGIVQLANRQAIQTTPVQHGWAAFRDAQRAVAMEVPHCGLAVTIDIGEADSIHPLNKQEVGRRLARWAAAEVYGVAGIRPHGPRYLRCEAVGSSLRVAFAAAGLRVRGGGKVDGFAIAGEDRKWSFADAVIVGETVVVSAAAVAKPVAVRYAWANNPLANVEDAEGLPMEPFRSDAW